MSDIVAIGLQELIIFDHHKTTDAQANNPDLMAAWNAKIAATLPEHVKVTAQALINHNKNK